ncbi:MAG: anti-sigma factor [Chloroflexota bacterium]|nr:anti-sigma factor [Chloroflexota bacterium]MDE2941102.1 anti-sigma factor [Chloroflexota bacterium]MDE3267372.1 anti-sigma factor [Chloroflexota bacterium]
MKCEEAGELIHAYLLGALDEDERRGLEAHVRGCPDCLAVYYEESQSMEMLLRVGDPVPAPLGLRKRILDMVNASARPAMRPGLIGGPLALLRSALRQPVAATAMAVVSITLVVLSGGAVLLWQEVNELKDEDSRLSANLQDQLDQIQEENERLAQTIVNQLDLAYLASMEGVSTVMLEGGDSAPKSTGMLMLSPNATWGVLLTLGLESLPRDKVYQLWLMSNNIRTSAGTFKVDSAGQGQLMVQGLGDLRDFENLEVSIEPAEGSPEASGANVLKGPMVIDGSQ